jgi:response regulator RpfG family c-di-GMP phosphodiesterase
VHTASSGAEALDVLDRETIEVIVTDQRMPGISGVDLLTTVRERFPDVLRLMLTGYTDIGVAVEAINRGEVYRLISKPWDDEELRSTVREALETARMRREIDRLHRSLRDRNRALAELNHTLEARVREGTLEVWRKHRELRRAYIDTVRALAEAIDAKDAYTRGHSERVGIYSARIARELGHEPRFIERIYLGGLLHDVGKIGVSDAIIGKPGTLTPEEYEEMKRHPEIGARILEPISFLSDLVPCVRHHHEWFDGSDRGYPSRLSGASIPHSSRVILVADTVEAMTSDRPYRKALPLDRVIDEIERFTGTQFDPVAAEGFLSIARREGEAFLERGSRFDIEAFVGEPGDDA